MLLCYAIEYSFCYTGEYVPQEQVLLCRHIFRQILRCVTFTEVLPGNDHLGHET